MAEQVTSSNLEPAFGRLEPTTTGASNGDEHAPGTMPHVFHAAAGTWLSRSALAALDWEKALYLLFIVIAIVTRFWDLGARVMSHDESLHTYFSYNLATGKGFAHTPLMHGPFLFHITALSYFLFGDNDFTSRIPPAIFGIVLVALPYFFRRWLGKSGALCASFALLISPSILYHARYIRQEEFILVWTLLTVLCTWRYLQDRQAGWLIGLAVVLAFHATDKSTSFLTVALFVAFLAPLALLQLYMTRQRWSDVGRAVAFAGVLAVAMLAASIIFESLGGLLANALGLKSVVSQLNPLTLTFDARSLVYAAAIALLALFTTVGLIVVLRYFFGAWLRFASAAAPAFNLLVVLVTTTMLMASPAMLLVLNPIWRLTTGAELVEIKLLGDMANLANNPTVIASMFSLSAALIAISIAIGVVWHWRRWLYVTGVFGAITVTLFTTVFTNATGIGTGFVGQLGYWMAQQEVKRGSQPPYYYFLLVPMYEYMLIIGSICAIVYIGYRAGRQILAVNTRHRADTAREQENTPIVVDYASQPLADTATATHAVADHPIVRALLDPGVSFPLFLVWWTIMTWIIYTIAGEKMPWLTVHFALPMALLTGWFLNHVFTVRPIPVGTENEPGQLRTGRDAHTDAHTLTVQRVLALAGLAVLIVLLTVRVISLLGDLGSQTDEGAGLLRWGSALLLTCAAISVSSFLMLRTSARWAVRAVGLASFAFLSVLTIRTAFLVSYINYDDVKEFLFYAHGAPGTKIALAQLEDLSKRVDGDMTLRIGYDSDVSWPMSWYMRDFPNARFYGEALPDDYADMEAIMLGDVNPKRTDNERKLQDNYTRFNYMLVWWPMQDYFDLTWERISYSLFNPEARAALWDIAFNRDFTRYAQVFNKNTLTPDTWSPGHRFSLYLRNDIAAKLWDYQTGAVAQGGTNVLSPTLRMVGPANLAFAPSGERLVIDHKANRVLQLDPTGNIASSWGGFGSATGKFNDPWGIAVDTDGYVFVADTFNHRIQKFDPNGEFLFAWGNPGVSSAPGNGRNTIFFGPRAIVLDAQGRLYVSDTGNKRIQIFDRDGNFVSQFGKSGTAEGEFNEPVGLAIDATGNIYVADTWNQRIQVFDPNFNFVRAWTVAPWQSMDPSELQSVDHKPFLAITGNLVVVSSPMTHQVLGYTLDGNPVDLPDITFGADSLPTGLTVSNGRLYVTDANSGAIHEFALPGG
ncbi:MAG: TIGR03663 family protein [Chloroflexi bacterium]|nr:TIGR03663 family protein [Chloroflexota bacterium]